MRELNRCDEHGSGTIVSGGRSGDAPAEEDVPVRGAQVVTVRGAEHPREVAVPTTPTQDTVGVTSVSTAIASVTPSGSVRRRSLTPFTAKSCCRCHNTSVPSRLK